MNTHLLRNGSMAHGGPEPVTSVFASSRISPLENALAVRAPSLECALRLVGAWKRPIAGAARAPESTRVVRERLGSRKRIDIEALIAIINEWRSEGRELGRRGLP
jgi:hypothetical protein